MEHLYFNEEWNEVNTESPKQHNIGSITNYTPRSNNSFRYNRDNTLSDLYFFE